MVVVVTDTVRQLLTEYCADPESFVRGCLAVTTFFFFTRNNIQFI